MMEVTVAVRSRRLVHSSLEYQLFSTFHTGKPIFKKLVHLSSEYQYVIKCSKFHLRIPIFKYVVYTSLEYHIFEWNTYKTYKKEKQIQSCISYNMHYSFNSQIIGIYVYEVYNTEDYQSSADLERCGHISLIF